MAGFKLQYPTLRSLGADMLAASTDPLDKAQEVARELEIAVAHGVTREIARQIGAWWEPQRAIIQPAEFIIGADGSVIASSYSSGPLGRIDAADVVRLLTARELRRKG